MNHMSILIVDDQASVIASLKSGINWSSLSVTNVYTARNAFEAREIILSYPIDILLSDIEMPKENGLSLLRWCRQQGYKFECIFLTSHADFFYAQEAIQLGSLDYILQPARYEDIERTIRKSIERIEEKQKQQTWLDFGKAAFSQKNVFLKDILNDWFTGKAIDLPNTLSSLEKMNIPLSAKSEAYLLWIQIYSWHSFPPAFEEWKQQAEEILNMFFSPYEHEIVSFCPDKTSMAILLYSGNHALMDPESYQSRLNMIYTRLTRQLSCSCAFYTHFASRLDALSETALNIQKERLNNICQNPGIFFSASQTVSQTVTHCSPEFLSDLEMYMTGRQAQKAEQESLLYLQSLNFENKLNHDTLLTFCRDYHHCAYNAARNLDLPAYSIPSLDDLLDKNSSTSVTLEFVSSYLKQLTSFFQSSLSDKEVSNNSLLLIEKYIRENLDKPLLCSEIAKAVYLSPDYISRLFHKEKGIPLKEYITLSKMKAAKNMLITTSLPISLIASKVGYDNFSHFSKIYKKVMGVTPSSERNKGI